MATCIQAEKRAYLNTSGLRNLRKSGRLPAIVFGKNAANEMIHISMKDFQKWLKQGATGFIELQLDGGKSISVLLEHLQRDPVSRQPHHVDFQLVQTGEIVRTKIPVKLVGTPVGAKRGGVVQVQDPYIEVEALPKHLPASFEYDISAMDVGDTVLVKDIAVPSEVVLVSGENELLISVTKP